MMSNQQGLLDQQHANNHVVLRSIPPPPPPGKKDGYALPRGGLQQKSVLESLVIKASRFLSVRRNGAIRSFIGFTAFLAFWLNIFLQIRATSFSGTRVLDQQREENLAFVPLPLLPPNVSSSSSAVPPPHKEDDTTSVAVVPLLLPPDASSSVVPPRTEDNRTPSTSTHPPAVASYYPKYNKRNSFASCVITMDDNYYWPEWLAYHMTFLPLTRLIVVLDPRSQTSPVEIFERFQPFINISIWNDIDIGFKGNITAEPDELRGQYVTRQKFMLFKCMKKFKAEGHRWVTFIDPDEYIIPNWKANANFRIQNATQSTTTPAGTTSSMMMTVADIWESNPHIRNASKHLYGDGCHSMQRIPIGIQESTKYNIEKDVPLGVVNASKLLTLKNRYRRKDQQKPAKSILDMEQLNKDDISLAKTNVHKPSRACGTETKKRKKGKPSKYVWPDLENCSFVVYHYPGDLDAFLFRKDARNASRTLEAYEAKYSGHPKFFYEDDSARFWIQDFVTKVGINMARFLLKGAGQVGR